MDRHLLYLWAGERLVANPFSHRSHNTVGTYPAPTSRPATPRDVRMSLSAASTELLDYLADSGYSERELEDTAHTLGYTEAQLEAWTAGEDPGELSADEHYYRVRLAAAMVEGIVMHKATVSEPAVLKATLADLRTWDEFYADTLGELWSDIRALEDTLTTGNFADSPRWCVMEAKFRRYAYLLWCVRSRLGLELFTGNLIVQRPEPVEDL